MKKKVFLCMIISFGLGTCAGAGGYYVVNRLTRKPIVKNGKPREIVKREKHYVFFSSEGNPVTLSEQEVFDVKQKYEDGVLPTCIADEYNMNAVMVCRIINSFKSI